MSAGLVFGWSRMSRFAGGGFGMNVGGGVGGYYSPSRVSVALAGGFEQKRK